MYNCILVDIRPRHGLDPFGVLLLVDVPKFAEGDVDESPVRMPTSIHTSHGQKNHSIDSEESETRVEVEDTLHELAATGSRDTKFSANFRKHTSSTNQV